MKKIITALILTITLLLALAVSASAAEPMAEGEAVSENIFDTVYGVILENSDKILSALAFGASLILMLVYKRGLLPILKGALGSLSASVSDIRDEAEKRGDISSELLSAATARLNTAEGHMLALSESLEALYEKLSATDKLVGDSEKMRIVMEHQIDMLYDIFISSSLPTYQKEAMGKKISDMRLALAEASQSQAEVSGDEVKSA